MEENPKFQPYWDPTLASNRDLRLELYRTLAAKKLTGYRRRIRAKVGLFFVWKSGRKGIRLIVDARMPNGCHQRPPKTKLGGAGALCELEVDFDDSDAALLDDGDGGPVTLFVEIFGDTGDVSDAFY